MDGLALLAQARDAGLEVRARGNRLVIRGPKRAENVARLLLDQKPVVLDALGVATHEWGDAAEAVAWFLASEPPSEPFVLRRNPMGQPFVTVLHPARYWRALRADIAAGPGRGRDAYGAVKADVLRLYELLGGGS